MTKIFGLVMLSAVLFVGCSGDGGNGPEEKQALTKAEYIEQANDACADLEDQFENLEQPQSADDVEVFVNESQERLEAFIADLRELKAPEDIADEVETMLGKLDEGTSKFAQYAEAAQEQDAEAIDATTRQIREDFEAADKVASSIGLDRCANPGPAT